LLLKLTAPTYAINGKNGGKHRNTTQTEQRGGKETENKGYEISVHSKKQKINATGRQWKNICTTVYMTFLKAR
jgi:hypothetical protein